MRAAFSKIDIEAEIGEQFIDAFKLHERSVSETLSTGVPTIDNFIGGIPRGAITEIFGQTSSGRTSLMCSLLGYATTHDEICALVDTTNAFAPTAALGVNFDRLLWIRCASNLEHAFKATDLLLHAGGFGVVVLDLGDVAGNDARRIITSWWYRFRRAIEHQQTSIVVISEEACTRSCAALTLELTGAGSWSTASGHASNLRANETNVLPMPHVTLNLDQPAINHGKLLSLNSIKLNQRRPLTSSLNEIQFKAISTL
jgi:recA bacterial DNA recombination protein